MNISCGDCSIPSPMNDWRLIRLTMKFGGVAELPEIAQLNQLYKDREHDKPFGQSILICPLCNKKQVVMLHKQGPEIEALAEGAGLASDVLFAKVERMNHIDLDAWQKNHPIGWFFFLSLRSLVSFCAEHRFRLDKYLAMERHPIGGNMLDHIVLHFFCDACDEREVHYRCAFEEPRPFHQFGFIIPLVADVQVAHLAQLATCAFELLVDGVRHSRFFRDESDTFSLAVALLDNPFNFV